jgi:hypothetical protein
MGEVIEIEGQKKPKKKSVAIDTLTKRSMKVVINGTEVVVPLDKIENTILNNIMASQGRAIVQKAIKDYKDQEQTPTPRELKDLIGAMKEVIDMTGMIFANGDIGDAPEQNVSNGTSETAIDFSEISAKKAGPDGGEPAAPQREEDKGKDTPLPV